jgi:hypothetical protein
MALSALETCLLSIEALSMSLGAVSARRLLSGLDALGVRNRRRRVGVLPLRLLSATRKALSTKNTARLGGDSAYLSRFGRADERTRTADVEAHY